MTVQCDWLVGLAAVMLEIVGGLSLMLSTLSRRERLAELGDMMVVGSVCGLGVITLVAAWMQIGCALMTGFTIAALMMAMIAHPRRELAVNPYFAGEQL